MKKILVIISIIFTFLSFSGTKEDLIEISQNFQKDKDIVKYEEGLKKIATQKSDMYTRTANFELATLEYVKANYDQSKKYLDVILNDKTSSNDEMQQAYEMIYEIGVARDNVKERLWAADKLVKLVPENNVYKLKQIVDNVIDKNSKNADKLYQDATKNMKINDLTNFNILLANDFASYKLYDEAKKYVNKNLNMNVKGSQIQAHSVLADIYELEGNLEESLKHRKTVSELTGLNDSQNELKIANILTDINKKEEALNKYLLVAELDPNPINNIFVVLQAEELKKQSIVDKHIDYLKAKLGKNSWYTINTLIVEGAINSNKLDIAKKYANKMINEDKNYSGHYILATIYANENNKNEAIKEAKKAMEYEITGAKELYDILTK